MSAFTLARSSTSTMTCRRTFARLLVPLTAWLVASGASGQAPPSPSGAVPQPRQKIGLVMSGGGARGGAHIGVIKALQELRVPIDAIAGTSIGAIVGGFYVSGMTVQDMQNLVESLEWEDAFLNVTPRKLKSFRRKRDDYTFLVNQKPGLNGGQFQLPAGLVQGQVFDMVISRETLRASQVKSFDDLALPFRAVATDLATGRPVVLESGDLARSLRASMSIPAALTPVEIDGRLLVDGGVSMNLPVEVAQQMGADVIIAVDVSSPLQARETLKSVVDVTTQLTNLLGAREPRRAAQEARTERRAARARRLPRTSARLTSRACVRRSKRATTQSWSTASSCRASLSTRSTTRRTSKACATRGCASCPRSISSDQEQLDDRRQRDRDAAQGHRARQATRHGSDREGDQQGLWPRVLPERALRAHDEDGETGLEVQLDKRSWGPHYLQLGVEYSSGGNVDSLFGLAASYLSTAINPAGGEWRATFVVGDEPQLFFGSLSAVRLEGTLLLRAGAELPVDDHQRVGRRSAHHRGPEPRGRSRVRRRPRDAELGRISLRRARGTGETSSASATRPRSPTRISGAASCSRASRPIRSTASRSHARARSRAWSGADRAWASGRTPTSIRCWSRSCTRTRGAGIRCLRRFATTRP